MELHHWIDSTEEWKNWGNPFGMSHPRGFLSYAILRDFACHIHLELNFAPSSVLTMWFQCCDLSLAAGVLCARVLHPPSDDLLVTQRTAWNELCLSQTWLCPSIFSWCWLTPIYAAFCRGISSQRKQEDNEETELLMIAGASHKFPMFSSFVALFILTVISHSKVTWV